MFTQEPFSISKALNSEIQSSQFLSSVQHTRFSEYLSLEPYDIANGRNRSNSSFEVKLSNAKSSSPRTISRSLSSSVDIKDTLLSSQETSSSSETITNRKKNTSTAATKEGPQEHTKVLQYDLLESSTKDVENLVVSNSIVSLSGSSDSILESLPSTAEVVKDGQSSFLAVTGNIFHSREGSSSTVSVDNEIQITDRSSIGIEDLLEYDLKEASASTSNFNNVDLSSYKLSQETKYLTTPNDVEHAFKLRKTTSSSTIKSRKNSTEKGIGMQTDSNIDQKSTSTNTGISTMDGFMDSEINEGDESTSISYIGKFFSSQEYSSTPKSIYGEIKNSNRPVTVPGGVQMFNFTSMKSTVIDDKSENSISPSVTLLKNSHVTSTTTNEIGTQNEYPPFTVPEPHSTISLYDPSNVESEGRSQAFSATLSAIDNKS